MKGLIFITKLISKTFLFIILFTILICIFFIPTSINVNSNLQIVDYVEDGNLIWPIPGHYRINSYYGKRVAPTTGASTYHKGIDIGASEGNELVAVTNGTITFASFLGGGGYTITITDENTDNGEFKYSYCHCSPTYIVSKGDYVYKGQVIGYVGPRYVYGVIGNQYSDPSNGKPTNGATTGPHLHFGMRINGNYANPLDYFPKPSN